MMKAKSFFPYLIGNLVVISFMTACNKSIVSTGFHPVTLPESGNQVIRAQNQFAFQLFQESLQQDSSSSNKLISPFSIYEDLSLAYNGSAGSTQAAMQNTMNLSGIRNDVLNSTNQALTLGLPKEDPLVRLNIANSIWYKNSGIQPLPPFLNIASEYYHAQVTGSDFSSATVNQINRWVSNATNGKINSIIDEIDPTDLMYLINAIYFKGQWKYSFDPKQTQNRSFATSNGASVQTPFMVQKNTFRYFQNSNLQIIELPYSSGDFNMYVVLPSGTSNLQSLIFSFDMNSFARDTGFLKPAAVQLYLPKWKYDYEIKNMIPELSKMGMSIAFSPHADFSNMYPANSGISITKVVHKTYIAVDEQGTEAAAVTGIGVGLTAVGPVTQTVMDVNQPFLYVIAEKNTGAVLFIGEVNNPAEAGTN